MKKAVKNVSRPHDFDSYDLVGALKQNPNFAPMWLNSIDELRQIMGLAPNTMTLRRSRNYIRKQLAETLILLVKHPKFRPIHLIKFKSIIPLIIERKLIETGIFHYLDICFQNPNFDPDWLSNEFVLKLSNAIKNSKYVGTWQSRKQLEELLRTANFDL